MGFFANDANEGTVFNILGKVADKGAAKAGKKVSDQLEVNEDDSTGKKIAKKTTKVAGKGLLKGVKWLISDHR